jgi:hypothetical protein
MHSNKVHGAVLMASTLVLFVMVGMHPSRIPADSHEALEHLRLVAGFAHALAVVGVWLSLWGLAGFSQVLGITRPRVVAALTAFVLPAAALCVAAMLDGFVIPELAKGLVGADAAHQAEIWSLVRFCVLIASAITRLYLFAVALAIVLWSWEAMRAGFGRALLWVSLAIAALAIALCFGGPTFVTVHELMLLVIGQSVWMVWVGVLLWRRA